MKKKSNNDIFFILCTICIFFINILATRIAMSKIDMLRMEWIELWKTTLPTICAIYLICILMALLMMPKSKLKDYIVVVVIMCLFPTYLSLRYSMGNLLIAEQIISGILAFLLCALVVWKRKLIATKKRT